MGSESTISRRTRSQRTGGVEGGPIIDDNNNNNNDNNDNDTDNLTEEPIIVNNVNSDDVPSDGPCSGGMKRSDSFHRRIMSSVINMTIERDFYRKDVALQYVKLGYRMFLRNLINFILLLILIKCVSLWTSIETGLMKNYFENVVMNSEHSLMELQFTFLELCSIGTLIVGLIITIYWNRQNPVFLVDFAVHKPEDDLECNWKKWEDVARASGKFDESSIDFQLRVSKKCGVGTGYYPAGIMKHSPPVLTMAKAREEAELVMFGAIEELLKKTGLRAGDIDIVVVNCSLFSPTPSMTAMIVNHFKMGDHTKTYNLSGMGCSAGLIAIDLAKDLLQVHKRSRCLVVSTENITQNWYFGNEKSMQVSNVLFRVGGSAVLLSNKKLDIFRSKYWLRHTVRTHRGGNNDNYNCIMEEEDADGNRGVRLSKEVMRIAGESLKVNITTVGPLALPISEQLHFFAVLICRKVFKLKMKPYIPDFKEAFDHFCIHTGGRGVIDEIQKNLELTHENVEPSRQTLWHFGNTSSSSIWYELAYSESQGKVKRGDRIWQIAFGSGFKCNSGIWKSLRNIHDVHPAWATKKDIRGNW